MSTASSPPSAQATAVPNPRNVEREVLTEHIVEVVSDSGEGAQKCGQIFGTVSAKMGNGAWTVEIIPAEIQPPPRTAASASGVRIRIGQKKITNWGDRTNLVIAFNEQVLLSRHRLNALDDRAKVLVEDRWSDESDPESRAQWDAAMAELSSANYDLVPVPIHESCLAVTDDPRRGKNMFVLGLYTWLYNRHIERVREQIRYQFRLKAEQVAASNIQLMELGVKWAAENLDFAYEVPTSATPEPMLVTNGNQAVGMGAIAAGMELCSMYPITPATSVSHYLAEVFDQVGGVVHQAEDEIAAIGVAIGASYAGKVALTVTSGPGLALKTEFIALAVMTETPLVIVDVQRGGPSTGLPTKVEQSDLLASIFGQPGDCPKIVIAPSTIEGCFHAMITARRIAEALRTVVIVLTDANLATGVQPFPRPQLNPRWMGGQPDMSPVPDGVSAFDWDDETGLSERLVPGRPNGMHVATGLGHDSLSRIDYSPPVNQRGCNMRSRKIAVFQQTLKTPPVHGEQEGDLLVIGWGSTRGAIEEAVDRCRAEGLKVGSLHLTFLSPLAPGLKEILSRYKRTMTVEINYSDDLTDPYITEDNRRRGQLCWLLRAHTLVDVDCWTRVPGEPLKPGQIQQAMLDMMAKGEQS